MIAAALLSILACDGGAPPTPTITPEQAEAKAEAMLEQADDTPTTDTPSAPPAATSTDGGGGEPVQVVLVWEGISALHKGFFSDAKATAGLAQGLSGTLADPADVYIRYNSVDMVGDLRIQLRPGQLERPPKMDGDVIDLQALAPITTALASYRSDIAARFDFRIESFRVGLEAYRGARVCIFSVAGKPPPDGRLLSPCVDINGQKQCGEPTTGGVRFAADVAKDIRACLR
ncbi:MAG: hypothetical protein AAFV53_17735 [Myxococcota bacterium]